MGVFNIIHGVMSDRCTNGINIVLILVLVVLSGRCYVNNSHFQRTVETYVCMEVGDYPDSVNLEKLIKEDKKRVALTFDDGPKSPYTERLLDGLKERNVKATFFVIGESVRENEALIKRMAEEGHIIGNHTYSHVQLSTLDYEACIEEIENTNRAIFDACGVTPKYIRPPFGSWNENVTMAVNMTEVLWDVDPLDWKVKNAGIVTNSVIRCADDGSIILLHDIYESSVDAAIMIIDELKAQGYEFVTVEELLLD